MTSGSIGPIFTKFSSLVGILIVDCRFDGSSNIAMTTNFSVKIGKTGLFIFIRSPGIPTRIAISPFWF